MGVGNDLHASGSRVHHTATTIASTLLLLLLLWGPEWWAHCRDHTSGHQLHFDSENEGVGIGGQVRHPLFSAVVYLSEGEEEEEEWG